MHAYLCLVFSLSSFKIMNQPSSSGRLARVLWITFLAMVHADSSFRIIRISEHMEWDVIDLPNKMCGKTVDYCKRIKAKKSSECSCFCEKSTFFEQSWQCIDNKEIRQLQECRHKFKQETSMDPLRVLSPQSKEIEGAVQTDVLKGDCRVTQDGHPGSNQYLDCDGQWRTFNSTVSYEIFNITRSWSKLLNIKLRPSRQFLSFQGRIIKLGIECKRIPADQTKRSCILFKIRGGVKCPISMTRKSSPVSNLRTFHLTTITAPRVTASFEKQHGINLTTASGGKDAISKGNTKNTRSNNRKVELISGATVASVSFAALLVLCFILIYKRKIKKHQNESVWLPPVAGSEPEYDSPKLPPQSCDKKGILNPSYGRGLDQALVLEMTERRISSSQDTTNKKSKTLRPIPRSDKYSKMNEWDPEGTGSDRGAVAVVKSNNYDHTHGKGERRSPDQNYDKPGDVLKDTKLFKANKEKESDNMESALSSNPTNLQHLYENPNIRDHYL